VPKRLSYFFFLKSVIILELQTTLMDELAKKLQYKRASKIDQPIEATNKTHNTKTKTYPKVKNNHFPRGGKPRHMASEEKKLNQLSLHGAIGTYCPHTKLSPVSLFRSPRLCLWHQIELERGRSKGKRARNTCMECSVRCTVLKSQGNGREEKGKKQKQVMQQPQQ
jgi:hypothetical protein